METGGNSGESVLREELHQGALYMAANSIQESILWIQAHASKVVSALDHNTKLEFESGMFELLKKLLRLAESENLRKVCDLPTVQTVWNSINPNHDTRRSRSFRHRKIADAGKSISKRFRLQELQTIEELCKELRHNISMSTAASVKTVIEAQAETTEERAVGFKLGLFPRQVHVMRDSLGQLASTESKHLALCMFTCDESFVRCCSTLKSISAVVDRLGTWVPELAVEMRRMKEDEKSSRKRKEDEELRRQNKEDKDVLIRADDVVMRQNKEDEDADVLIRDEDEDEDEDEDWDEDWDGDGDGDGEGGDGEDVDVDVDGEDEDDEWDEVEYVREYKVEKKAEEYYFAAYRGQWERTHGSRCNFEDPTLLSPMQFTHYMPGNAGKTPMDAQILRTMQIYSIKVTETKGIPLDWPLSVYGVVAARDVVDYRRNLLFLRTRDDCQILRKEKPYLHLTGPSRAIMSGDSVTIEAQLHLRGTVQSEDKVLISKAFPYDDDEANNDGESFLQGLCTIVLSCKQLEQSVQATILSVRVLEGCSLPCGNSIVCTAYEYKGGVKCISKPFVLLSSQAGTMPVDEEGYLELSRNMVSVSSTGRLLISIEAGELSGHVDFQAESSNFSVGSVKLGNCELEITVAWSLLVESQHFIKLRGYIEPYRNILGTCMPCMKLCKNAC